MSQAPPASSLAGSFRLFRVGDIAVFVHWSWLVVAYLELQFRTSAYQSQIWNVVEYVALFAIVLLHEFGHALACRQVGGKANEIVLWPLGGVAFVQPPARPGAWLWSIAAGPLVNLVLIPITLVAFTLVNTEEMLDTYPDIRHFLFSLFAMNVGLFIFNMLPIYPLDGGQILQSLLWFVIGRAKSLKIASVIGLIASIAFFLLAMAFGEWWIALVAGFAGMRCWAGIQQANFLARLEESPRHMDASCPDCGAHPPAGPYWVCPHCQTVFDIFAQMAACPGCGMRAYESQCLECQKSSPHMQWYDKD